jgi:hypothetical protein
MIGLEEIEAIKRLKYKYFRCLDCKAWKELAECFAEDATAAYDSGKYSYDGRDAILGFLEGALGSRDVVSLHQGHHPEIDVQGNTAKGIWYLEDYLIFVKADTRLRGAGFYHDEYVKLGGLWKLEHTGYVRTFEEIQTGDPPRWQVTGHGNHLVARN